MKEDYFDRTIEEFEGEADENRGYSPRHERIDARKSSPDFWARNKTLIFVGAGILLIVILIALFSGGNSELSPKDFTAISTRVDFLENRLTRLEEMELRIASLQEQGNMLRQSLGETEILVQSLTQKVDVLTKRLEAQEKEITATVKEAKVREDTAVKPASPPKQRVHEVSRGETLYRISSKYGLTVDELCRLNNINPSQPIYPGQKLIIAPKSE